MNPAYMNTWTKFSKRFNNNSEFFELYHDMRE